MNYDNYQIAVIQDYHNLGNGFIETTCEVKGTDHRFAEIVTFDEYANYKDMTKSEFLEYRKDEKFTDEMREELSDLINIRDNRILNYQYDRIGDPFDISKPLRRILDTTDINQDAA